MTYLSAKKINCLTTFNDFEHLTSLKNLKTAPGTNLISSAKRVPFNYGNKKVHAFNLGYSLYLG